MAAATPTSSSLAQHQHQQPHPLSSLPIDVLTMICNALPFPSLSSCIVASPALRTMMASLPLELDLTHHLNLTSSHDDNNDADNKDGDDDNDDDNEGDMHDDQQRFLIRKGTTLEQFIRYISQWRALHTLKLSGDDINADIMIAIATASPAIRRLVLVTCPLLSQPKQFQRALHPYSALESLFWLGDHVDESCITAITASCTALTDLEVLPENSNGITSSAIHDIARCLPSLTRLSLSSCESVNDAAWLALCGGSVGTSPSTGDTTTTTTTTTASSTLQSLCISNACEWSDTGLTRALSLLPMLRVITLDHCSLLTSTNALNVYSFIHHPLLVCDDRAPPNNRH
jgi:hypothetical protein